jgi:hypothetical protein
LPGFDFHARLLTLPGIFDSTPECVPADVPYLHVDGARVERVGRVLARALQKDGERRRWGDGEKAKADAETGRRGDAETGGTPAGNALDFVPASPRPPVSPSSSPTLRVGLVWQGNTAHKGDRARSIALEKFGPLARVPGVRLVSLQKGFGCEQIEQCKDGVPVVEWSDPADTTAEALLDTAAAMRNLDLVIAVDTSVAHLAGALGVPVWVAMPLACDWRWLLDREDTPWYPTMRLFRQRELGEWDDVIARMAEALGERVRPHVRSDREPRQAERLSA